MKNNFNIKLNNQQYHIDKNDCIDKYCYRSVGLSYYNRFIGYNYFGFKIVKISNGK